MQTSSPSFHLYRVTLANTICNINTVTGKTRFKMDDMSNIITSLSNTISPACYEYNGFRSS